MSEEQFLTSEGAERLRIELADLKGPRREEISKRLRDAISNGDLSENADYHKAKEDQAFLEGRIQELEYLLKNATIVDESTGPSNDMAGSWRTSHRPGRRFTLKKPTSWLAQRKPTRAAGKYFSRIADREAPCSESGPATPRLRKPLPVQVI
jgi:hypothetical protein